MLILTEENKSGIHFVCVVCAQFVRVNVCVCVCVLPADGIWTVKCFLGSFLGWAAGRPNFSVASDTEN